MASLQMRTVRNGGKRWKVRWRGDDKHRSLSFSDTPDDYRDACELVNELKRLEMRKQPGYELDAFADRFLADLRKRRQPPITVAEAVDLIVNPARDRMKPRSFASLMDVRRSLVAGLGDMPLPSLSADTLTGWFADFAGRAPTHSNKCLALLKRSLREAGKDGQVFDRAILDIQPCRLRPRRRRALTMDEVEMLAGSSTEPHAIRFLALTGLRIGELFNLTDDCYEQDGGRHYIVVRDSKTQAGLRRVVLPKQAVVELKAQMIRRKPGSPYLFPTPVVQPWSVAGMTPGEGGRKWIANNFRYNVFRPAVEAAGLGDVKPHDLRSTNATLRMDAGTPDHELADQMGWSLKAVAEMRRLYVQARADHGVSAANRLDGFLGQPKREAM